MTRSYTIKIHNRQTGDRHTVRVPEDRYILQSAENQGVELPFSCPQRCLYSLCGARQLGRTAPA